jgi:hypothetical protein
VSDTSQSRDYRFAYGAQGKIEVGATIDNFATISVWYSFYLIHAFDNTGNDELKAGTLGTNVIHILKPRITVHLFGDLSIGFEHDIYFNNHSQRNYDPQRYVNSEQRIFFMFYWEDKQRKGHYN